MPVAQTTRRPGVEPQLELKAVGKPVDSVSVIVPVLDEAAGMAPLLGHLAELRRQGAEVVMVDGGSSDNSLFMARAAGFVVLQGTRGRATQMNRGALASTGRALVFLHADTRLPPGALERLTAALAGSHAWGRFDVRIDGRPLMLRVVAAMMNARSRLSGIATGDQAMFMTREAFDAVGGFPEQPLMEDIEISKRLLRLGRPACLRDLLTTSGRRWEQRGVWRTIWLMWRLRWAYWRGVPPAELARAYR